MKRVLGLMSGTSADAVDVAVIETDGTRVGWHGPHDSYDLTSAERAAILSVAGRQTDYASAERAATDAHCRAVERFLAEHDTGPIDLIGFHGQTVFHAPADGITVQLGDADRLSQQFKTPVVFDFRSADVAAGGEGAPFAPLYHQALARDLDRPLAVLNLGGVGNVTWLGEGGDDVLAFDTGPASAMIDDWMTDKAGKRFDKDGQAAAAGVVDENWLTALLDNSYFDLTPPKSLDRNHFHPCDWPDMSVEDGAATLTAFTVASVAMAVDHMPSAPRRWLVTGGGRLNPVIMAGLADKLGVPVDPVDVEGWRGDALEAEAFAFLAARSVAGLPLSVPGTTGVPEPVSGGRLVSA